MQQLPLSGPQRHAMAAAGLPADTLCGAVALRFAPSESICTAGHPLAYFMLVLAGRAKACRLRATATRSARIRLS